MSRPKKMHEPLKGGFNQILSAVAMGSGKGKSAAQALARKKASACAKTAPKKS
jgi:hypothetical protein